MLHAKDVTVAGRRPVAGRWAGWAWAMPLAALLASGAAAQPARVVPVRTDADLRAALARAGPGTVLELAPGAYGGLHHAGLKGSAAAPIVIRSADPRRPAVFTGQVQLSDAAYVVLQDFVSRGSRSNGLNLDDGGTFETPAHHLILRGLVVEDNGPRGNLDGIKLSGVDDFLVEDCTVRRWGSGGSAIDMVGCHRGLFLGCRLEDEDRRAATGIQAKGGSSEIVVRGCTFAHAGQRAVNIGGSTGEAFFRPQGALYEARRILVLGCTFAGSEAPIAFVTTEESQVLFNTVLFPKKWVLRILQEKPAPPYIPCRRNTFAGNLVVWHAGEVSTHVNVGPNTEAASFRFAGNSWYCSDRPAASRPRLPAFETDGLYGRSPGGLSSADGSWPSSPASPTFGASAAGEQAAWEKLGRPLVAWAASEARGSPQATKGPAIGPRGGAPPPGVPGPGPTVMEATHGEYPAGFPARHGRGPRRPDPGADGRCRPR
jgi:hypothetical protein